MKTSLIFITLSALLTMANIASASVNNKPNIINTRSERNKLFSLIITNIDGDKTKTGKKQEPENNSSIIDSIAPATTEKDFSYLSFDVNKYVNASETGISDLPVSDFDYLRFDVNKYIEQNPDGAEEMPVNDFDYLRFDVNRFIKTDTRTDDGIGELPVAE